MEERRHPVGVLAFFHNNMPRGIFSGEKVFPRAKIAKERILRSSLFYCVYQLSIRLNSSI